MLPISKRDYALSSGEIISIGVNFRALELMAGYPGGLNKLQREMKAIATADPESDAYGEEIQKAMFAMGFMLHALIAAGGERCSREEALMAIGPEDFEQLNTIFEEFSEAMARAMPKNGARRMMAKAL